MKVMNLLLAVFFTFSICVAFLPGDLQAASKKKEVTSTKSKKVDKTKKTTKKKSTKKATKTKESAKKATKTKKNIPSNVNINSASKDVLMQLPGIGPVTADAIVKYRKANGKFKNFSDLSKVKGIGDKTMAKLKPYLKKI